MNHPTIQEWVEFLYQELAPERQTACREHLENCQECRAQLDHWRAVRQQLGSWKLRPGRSKPLRWSPRPAVNWLRWALAAGILLMAGYGLARLTAPAASVDSAAVRELVVRELRSELGKFAAEQGQRQDQLQQAITKTLGRLEARRLVDYTNLRQDMETVAVLAEGELLNTQEDLAKLVMKTKNVE